MLNILPKKDLFEPFQPHYNYYFLHFIEENFFTGLSLLIYFSSLVSTHKEAVIDHIFLARKLRNEKIE